MAGKKISITLSPERLEMIERALGHAPEAKLSDEDLGRLVSLGLNQWLDTFFGSTRYRTTTEMYVDWLRDIYTTFLLNEDPNERRLFIRMGFPYGQAAYMSRVLRYERPTTARIRGLQRLHNELGNIADTAKDYVTKKRGDERLTITITKAARLELDAILGDLVQQGERVHALTLAGTISDYQHVLIVAEDVEILHKIVTGILKSLQPEG